MHYLRLDEQYITLLSYDQEKLSLARQGVPTFALEHRQLRSSIGLRANLRAIRAVHNDFLAVSATEVLLTSPVSIVPLSEFDESNCARYHNYVLKHCFDTSSEYRVFYDSLPFMNAVLLYAQSESNCRCIEAEFGEVHYRSAFSALLQRFSEQSGVKKRHQIYVHSREGMVDIAVFDGQRLLSFNSFEVHAVSDVVYYVLSTAGTFAFDVEHLHVKICGVERLCENIKQELHPFARNISILNLASQYLRHPLTKLEGIPYDLATLILNT